MGTIKLIIFLLLFLVSCSSSKNTKQLIKIKCTAKNMNCEWESINKINRVIGLDSLLFKFLQSERHISINLCLLCNLDSLITSSIENRLKIKNRNLDDYVNKKRNDIFIQFIEEPFTYNNNRDTLSYLLIGYHCGPLCGYTEKYLLKTQEDGSYKIRELAESLKY